MSTYDPSQEHFPGRSIADGNPVRPVERFRIDGKFFAQESERFRIRGVTYGPFAPDANDGSPGARLRVSDDFARIQDVGINAIRTYQVPPEWFLDLAGERGLAVLMDVPWAKHVCFLQVPKLQAEARAAVGRAAALGRRFPNVLGYSIGNEIPADIARWHGAKRIERFLHELSDVARQVDPQGLITYANFPPTEYLDLRFLDFATFNVYLHAPERFRAYLSRLLNLVGDRPLVLGELGMDTLRHGEAEQSQFLVGHLRQATLMGLAGAFVFSWTDDWHTGGHAIDDWAFGLTDIRHVPKPSYYAIKEIFTRELEELVPKAPRVSVVVCSYNGGQTLEECLRSLLALHYRDYEIIVVDDGSTDETRAILERFPAVHAISQPNLGLSIARNVGLRAASGRIIAYTDSDCVADPDWLTYLVDRLMESGAAAVGGPNLSPEDGWLAACVAAAPGQPIHVLKGDEVAEHIPGCNMAFRREALEAIGGFDPRYRRAGDDVDVSLRLQQAGCWIAFAPGAVVWHHRRQGPLAYLRQQAGYGEAEALLRFKHPDKFTGRGHGKWSGVIYGVSSQGPRFTRPTIFRGRFGTGLFQTVYQPGLAHWAMLPGTLEWHWAVLLLALVAAIAWPAGWILVTACLMLSVLIAGLQAVEADLALKHRGWATRLLILGLCYAQPLVRSWARYRTRMAAARDSRPVVPPRNDRAIPARGIRQFATYWCEGDQHRTDLLGEAITSLSENRWTTELDPGWSEWDLVVHCNAILMLEIGTVQEEHGAGRRLIRVRYRPRLRTEAIVVVGSGLTMSVAVLPFAPWMGGVAIAAILAFVLHGWIRGRASAAQVEDLFDSSAERMGMVPCPDLRPPRVKMADKSPVSQDSEALRDWSTSVPAGQINAFENHPVIARADTSATESLS